MLWKEKKGITRVREIAYAEVIRGGKCNNK